MVYLLTNEVLQKIIHQRTNVLLHFDIRDIGQSFHRVNTQGALWHSQVTTAESCWTFPGWRGGIPNLVFDVFFSLIMDHM